MRTVSFDLWKHLWFGRVSSISGEFTDIMKLDIIRKVNLLNIAIKILNTLDSLAEPKTLSSLWPLSSMPGESADAAATPAAGLLAFSLLQHQHVHLMLRPPVGLVGAPEGVWPLDQIRQEGC